MILYKGYLMNENRDFVEVARQFDNLFADALEEFLETKKVDYEDYDYQFEEKFYTENAVKSVLKDRVDDDIFKKVADIFMEGIPI